MDLVRNDAVGLPAMQKRFLEPGGAPETDRLQTPRPWWRCFAVLQHCTLVDEHCGQWFGRAPLTPRAAWCLPSHVAAACRAGDEPAVVAWLDSGGRADARADEDDSTLLMGASGFGQERLVDTEARAEAKPRPPPSRRRWGPAPLQREVSV